MERKERIKLMLGVRQSVHMLVQAVFDEIDKDLDEFTFTKDGVKLIRAPRARLAIKSLRNETLDRIKAIGKEYEGETNE